MLKLAANRKEFRAEISDDGRGFVVAASGEAATGSATRGGQLQIDSAPGRGTRLTLITSLK